MSTAKIFNPITPRPAPVAMQGVGYWVRVNLFGTPLSTLLTVLFGGGLFGFVLHLLDWGVLSAVWQADSVACQSVQGQGACWGIVAEKYRIILFGRYPFEEQWRPLLATVLLMGLVIVSCMRQFWHKRLLWAWIVGFVCYLLLMRGGVLGLSAVDTRLWGGLPLTILLSTVSLAAAFPLAIVLALGRLSHLPIIRALSTVYIELIRGVPLISVLFMASFLFPLFLPQELSIDVLIRVLVALSLFTAAYLAEVVRGGLQAIPKGQHEAAASLGLSYWQTQRKIVLPQALSIALPSIMNNFISTFKDTSLVTIVSLYELTGALDLALDGDTEWVVYKIEGYIFIALIYFLFCFSLSRYSQWVEKHINHSKAR